MMLTRASILKLTARLALPASGLEQDWDVELADKDRLREFLATYESSEMSADDRAALMALMLASIDRYLEAHATLPDEWSAVRGLLLREPHLHRERVEYWERRDEDDPEGWFLLTPYLRRLREANVEE